MKQIITLFLVFTSVSFSQNFWEKSLDISGYGEWDACVHSIAANSEGHLYTFDKDTDSSGLYKVVFLCSEENGETWMEKSILDTVRHSGSYHLTINSNGDIFAYAYDAPPCAPWYDGEQRMYRSTDNGESWTKLNFYGCTCLLINSAGVIFSIISGELKISYDNGDSWEFVSTDVRDVFIDKDDNIFYVRDDKIYKSIDDGENWILFNEIQDGIDKLVKNSKGDIIIKNWPQLLILPEGNDTTSVILDSIPRFSSMYDLTDLYIDNEDNIYVLPDDKGILFSSDNGNNWTELNSGIEDLFVRSMVQNIDGYLFIGTNDGIYRSTNPITNIKENVSSEKLPEKFQLSQNYPNPFNPSTTINYSILKQSNVTLKVFDVLGGEIVTLVNKEQPRGNYEVKFDGSNLTSGIYLYRMKAGEYTETRKMLYLK